MTRKADFNAAERPTVVEGPGTRVISADRGGTPRESLVQRF
jgi:hypothetical protein